MGAILLNPISLSTLVMQVAKEDVRYAKTQAGYREVKKKGRNDIGLITGNAGQSAPLSALEKKVTHRLVRGSWHVQV